MSKVVLDPILEVIPVSRDLDSEKLCQIQEPLPKYDIPKLSPHCLTVPAKEFQEYVVYHCRLPSVDLKSFCIFYQFRDSGIELLRRNLEEETFKVEHTYQDRTCGAGLIAHCIAIDFRPNLEEREAASSLLPFKTLFKTEQGFGASEKQELGVMLDLLADFAGYKLFKFQSAGQMTALLKLCEEIIVPGSQEIVLTALSKGVEYVEKALYLLSIDLQYKPNYQFAPHFLSVTLEQLALVSSEYQQKIAQLNGDRK